MNRILKYMMKYWKYYIPGFACLGAGLFLDLNNPRVIGRIIDEVVVAGNLDVFKTLMLMMFTITLGRGVFGYIKEILFDFAGVNIACEIRESLFDHIQSLSADFFEEKNTGELMARIKEDADRIWQGVSFGIMLVVEVILNIILATIFMVRISPKLSLFALLTLPVIGFIAIMLERRIGQTYEKISEQNALLNTTAQENIAGVRLVKAFARERYEISKFLKHNRQYYELNLDQARTWSKYYPKLEMITNTLPILVIVVGGALVVGEDLSIGTLIMFSGYMNMIVWPMRMIGWLSNIMAEARASRHKIDTIYNSVSKIYDEPDAEPVEKFTGQVDFKHVSFEIDGSQVLKDISFSVMPGKTLAIMGETGSGKSSIMNLLIRIHNVTAGEIAIDGRPINKITLNSLRKNIAIVMQDTFLFSDTIEENIKFGARENISNHRMMDSANHAEVHDFVSRMESNYQTVIGEKGIGLSGGQKQRISIARALAKHANILVFDDSTSALDMETEQRIQKKIDMLTGVTKIIIAHRISAVKMADEILILEKGRIVERGDHQALMALKGRYYETCHEQYEGMNEAQTA